MRVGNDIKGKVNGQVILTVEDIDLLLPTIRFWSKYFWLIAGYDLKSVEPMDLKSLEVMDLKSLEVMEKQLEFMEKEMQDEYSKKA